MKKWIFIGLGAIVVILIVVVVVGLSKLGPLVKMAINTYGPKITDTELNVGDVGISLFSGEAKLKKFFLGNPKGFKSESAMKIGSVDVDVDEGSLTKDTIIIQKVEIIGPEITYEKKGKTDNFQALLANVQKNLPQGQSAKKEPEKEGAGKKLVINDLIIKQGKVKLALDMPGGVLGDKEISTDLPDIHLTDIGKNKGGSSPADVAKEIFEALYAKITSPNVIGALDDQLKKLGGNAAKALEGVTQEGLKGATGVVESAGKEAGSVTDKVKGLFQKKD
jgi:AsmA family